MAGYRSFSLLLLALTSWGCAAGSLPARDTDTAQPARGEEEAAQLPTGFGTLLQDQITLRLQSGDLLIKVTPLAEEIIRLTAPDTYERLRSLAGIHGPRVTRGAIGREPSLFLVSLFSYQPDVTFQPEDLNLVNRGLRLRPLGIAPMTPSWETQRLGQQETAMAVYAFDGGIEWEADLTAEYRQLRNDTWRDQILPVLEAERAKVRARSGGGGV
jgi:hypothetical protein